MKTKNSYFSKTLVILMAIMMVFTMMPSAAFAAGETANETAKVTVTILGDNGNRLVLQDLTVNKFNVKPFLTDQTDAGGSRTDENDNFQEASGITLANALIEAVYYLKAKQDVTADAFATPEVQKTVKDNLNIYNGKYGLSTASVLDDYSLVMSAINNAFSGGLGDSIKDGDKIVFYQSKYPNTYNYAYFDVMKISARAADGYPVINLKLKANELGWTEVTPIENMSIYKDGDTSDYAYATTNKSGVAEFEVHGSNNTSGNDSFMLYGNDYSGTKCTPYLKVSYTFNPDASTDAGKVTNISVSEVPKKDTSLKTFTAKIYGDNTLDLTNYVGNRLPLEISSNVNKVILTIIPEADTATISGDGIKKGDNEIAFAQGETSKDISFTVTNESDSETYSLQIIRSSQDAISEAKQVAEGILKYTGNSDSTYNADWILSKHALGQTISEAEKTAFLKTVLNTKEDAVGTMAKNALALAALGIDATKIPGQNDSVINSVEKIYSAAVNQIIYPSHKAYMLMLYDLGVYDIPSEARSNLIKNITDSYNEWHSNGIDSSAMILEALAPYYQHADDENGYNGISKVTCQNIKTNIDAEIAYYKSAQQENGTFGNNANTTAMVIRALAALGIDADGADFKKASSGKTALSALFTFKTPENTLGWQTKEHNAYASSDGLTAIAAYLKYYNNGNKGAAGSIYRFTASVAPYTNWPDAKLSTAIIAVPSKTEYAVNEKVNKGTDLTVKVVYNSNDKDTKTLTADDFTVEQDFSAAGIKQVTVKYNGLTTNYNVTVKDASSQLPTEIKNVSFTLNGLSSGTITEKEYAIAEGQNVLQITQAILNKHGISVTIKNGNYIASIGGLGEFDKGPNSGWLYSVNGVTPPTTAANEYILTGGENIVWYYTKDYTKEPGVFTPENKSDVTTSGASGSATTTAPTDVKVSEKTNADGTKETVAAVKVDSKHHDEIIKQAAEKKSAEIVLEVSKADSKGADNVQLTLDVAFVKNVADKTNADLTVNTENGKVTLDQETIKTVLGAAKGATITLEVTKVAKPTEAQKKAAGANGHVISLTVKSGNQIISDFNKGKATVMVELVSRLIGKKVAAIHIADDGTIEQLAGKVLTVGGKQYYEFATPHFSTFAIVDADEVGLDAAEEPTVDAKALVSKLTPAARSAKTAKKNVKVTTSLDKQDKEIISQLKDAGYTVKYRFYRSTKKAAGYKSTVTKKNATYTSTSGKKGTKYFYKVQVRVYDASGKLAAKTALKQCRCASRTWNK